MAETKRLLGDDVEPRHPSNNATETLQCIMSKLGPNGLWELLRVLPGQRHPAFDPNPNAQVPGTPTGCCPATAVGGTPGSFLGGVPQMGIDTMGGMIGPSFID